MSANRVAVVTGACQGIGRGIALRLAKDGLDVAVNDIPANASKLDDVVSEIEKHGRRAVAVTGDVSVESDVDNLIAVTVRELGGVDVFVANAGVNLLRSILDTSVEQWERLMNINARGVFMGYRAAARQMIKQGRGGRIIGACSVAGKKAYGNQAVYSASKFAVRGLTQAAAAEWGPHGITVNAYAPGIIETPMVHTHAMEMKASGDDPNEEWLKNAVNETPVRSLGSPEDIAGLVSYIASEESKFVTGQAININGGVFFD